MKCLVVSGEFHPVVGGAGAAATNLARGLAQAGHQVEMLTWDWGASHLDHDKTLPFSVTRRPGQPPSRRWDWIVTLGTFSPQIASRAASHDVVILADWLAQVHGNAARPWRTTPTFCLVHGSEVNAFASSTFLRIATRGLYENIAGCLCDSAYSGHLLQSRFPRVAARSTVIGVAVAEPAACTPAKVADVRRRLGIAQDECVFLQLSRLVPRKGHRLALQALRQLGPDGRRKVRYIIAGDGELKGELLERIRTMGLEGCVDLVGHLDAAELPGYFGACDVFLMPSVGLAGKVEGFGMVFVEAGHFGKPSIGTTHGAVPEVVLDGVTGVIVPENDIAALAGAILAMKEDPARRAVLGRHAAERARREFSCSAVARRALSAMDALSPSRVS